MLLTNLDTDGTFALVTVTLPPFSAGAPLHQHPNHAEGCYVLDGALAVTQGLRTAMLHAGHSTLVPAGVEHTYWNPTATSTTILLIYTPGCAEEQAFALARDGFD